MRIMLDNGYEEVGMNVRVEEDELVSGRMKYSTRLSDGQFDKAYKMQRKSGYLLVRPYKACDFVKARLGIWVGIDANLIWEM